MQLLSATNMFMWSFMPILRLFCDIAATMLCSLRRYDPAHVSYTKVNIFVQYYYAKSQRICSISSLSL